jgi:hypothetical protein
MLTTPEAFQAAGKIGTTVVEIPEWNNDTVTIQELSAQTLIDELKKYDERTGMAKLIIASVVKGENDRTPVFQDTKEHIALILNMGMKGVVRLAKAINEFNGVGADTKNKESGDSKPITSTASPSV